MDIIRHIKDVFNEQISHEVVKTCYSTLDNTILGLRKREVTLFASTPGVGKTAMLLNMALKIAENNVPVLFITYETTARKIAQKFLGLLSNIDPFLIEKGDIPDNTRNILEDSQNKLLNLPIFISEQFMFTDTLLKEEAEKIKQHRIEVVFVDSLQFIQYSKHENPDERDIENIMFLKNFARTHNLALGVTTQIRSRDIPQGKMPTLTDIGGEEEPADMVFILTRPYAYSVDQYVGEIEEFVVQVAKNRNGPSGTFKFSFSRRSLIISERSDSSF